MWRPAVQPPEKFDIRSSSQHASAVHDVNQFVSIERMGTGAKSGQRNLHC